MECIKFVMFGFNVVFWVIGAVMLGVGIWLAVDPGAFDSLGAAESAGMDNDMWAFAVYTFIAIGALVFVLGFLGLWGACVSESTSIPLWIYSVLVGIIILTEIVIVIVTAIYWDSVDEDVAVMMKTDVVTKYISETSADALSSSWNTMQQQWECCGSYDYRDYKGSLYDQTDHDSDPSTYVPYTCCDDTYDLAERFICQQGVEDHVHSKGCYYALREFLDESAPIIIGLTCTFAALQVVGLILACCLIHKKSSSDKYV